MKQNLGSAVRIKRRVLGFDAAEMGVRRDRNEMRFPSERLPAANPPLRRRRRHFKIRNASYRRNIDRMGHRLVLKLDGKARLIPNARTRAGLLVQVGPFLSVLKIVNVLSTVLKRVSHDQ